MKSIFMTCSRGLFIALLVATSLSLTPFISSAQSETDVVRYSRSELAGSSRYKGMAGAMGAVGADFSSVRQNPAGLGLNRRYFGLSFSSDLERHSHGAEWMGKKGDDNTSHLTFSELSLVMLLPTSDDTDVSLGFGFQREYDFSRKVNISAANPGASLADYVSAMLNNIQNRTGGLISHKDLGAKNFNNPRIPWLGILAYEGGWIDSNDEAGGVYFPRYVYGDKIELPTAGEMWLEESGSKFRYDMNIGVGIGETFYFGSGLDIHSISYQGKSNYTEWFLKDDSDGKEDYLGLDGLVESKGVGMGLSVGVIYAPVPELRLGAAYHSPTWWSMERDFRATASSRYGGDRALLDEHGNVVKDLKVQSEDGLNRFSMRTPGRFAASAALILGQRAVLSADYEYIDVGTAKLSDDEVASAYQADNSAIKEDFGSEHIFRLGAEFRLTNRLSLRAGTMQGSQPVKNKRLTNFSGSQEQEVLVAGTTPHYVLPGKSSAYTLGWGYRITPEWSLDMALVWQRYESHLITFPFINDEGALLGSPAGLVEPRFTQKPITLNRDKMTISATLAYRF
ncbi:hypothetical protein HQ45_05060 [Porphyromonas crevioricanis]|nr:outer membrane protein transport protein [Porphyromonas crevioricanis]KGN90171.1 hypothetical protein HQ45_05060 [Porphyromonas crevioricanis]